MGSELRILVGVGSSGASTAPSLRVIFRRFWPIMRRYRWQLALSCALVVVAPAIDTAQIWIFKLLIDDVLVPPNFHAFVPIALAYLGFAVAQGVAGFCDELLATWLGERFVLDLRSRVFEHLNGLSLDFFDRRELGDTLSRLTGDIDSIEALLVSGVTRTLSYAVEILFFAGALFYLDWRLALSALVVAPVFLVAARYFSARIKKASREQRKRAGSITATAEEGLSNLALVQAYNNVRAQTARFDRENLGRFDAQMAATKLRALFTPLIDLLETLGALSVLGLGIWELTHDRITLGGLLVFVGYLTRLYSPVRGAGRLSNTLYAASASAERIIELLDEQPSVREATYPERLHRARGALRVRGLGFGYPDGPRVLHDLTFSVQQGETVALVGPSGAGKSTLGKLLVRLYDPDEGSIVLDGHDLRAYLLTDLRANVALVLQEILVFDATVRDNILFGRAGATEEQLRDAAEAADALEFIEGLPEGWDTRVGQRGRLLSGGQRQRLALARAMIRDAPILLLDEPTTGLDAESTERVLAPMRRLMADRDRTTLVISHNLLTVTDADQIIYLDQGRITGQGTHQDLLRRHEGYARLYNLHRERPPPPSDERRPPMNATAAGPEPSAAPLEPAAAPLEPAAAGPEPPVVPAGDELAPGYEVIEHVRRGADLDCYEVWSAARFCRCFAKTPRPDRAGHASTVRHLRREGRLLRTLTHPHLVRGYDWLTPDDAPPVLVTENLTGATLRWLIDTHGRLDSGDLAQLGLHLCSVLRYLHGQGVLHLDVKPSNIVAVDGVARLIDLSLARRPGRCTPGYGTVGYLSPEQLVGARVTEAADVWGLGLVLYEAATGVRTYRVPSADSHASLASYSALGRYESVLVRPVRRLRAARRLPVDVADAIDGCLSLQPKDRPTLGELADTLETLTG